MKIRLFAATLLLAASLCGCTIAEQDADGLGRQFEQGITGQGRIVPNNPTNDSFGPEFQ